MDLTNSRIAMFLGSALVTVVVGAVPADAASRPLTGTEKRAEPSRVPSVQARVLPNSFGRTFATLDEYLAHLRRYAGPIDLPYYREIRPGVYEQVTTIVPAPPRRTYTRAQLMAMFGFTR